MIMPDAPGLPAFHLIFQRAAARAVRLAAERFALTAASEPQFQLCDAVVIGWKP
jgi:hypothetical protein